MIAYLSGPITGIADYRTRFEAAEIQVEELGDIQVLNPAREPDRPDWSWGDWIIYDLHMLRRADVMIVLPGSEKSAGCAIEREFAKGHDIPIIRLEDARDWAQTIHNWRNES